ncbi:PAS domain-containing sensor histidine kinase [Terriglobus aquaticus]|uniref:histidine kinase n=1 Tax=Terriglobus aquaticus TaxID=940139 RepID=A0ABW9KH15_9BACT|nr:ATP-binding protein [Terriglobus aquaticus]
MMGSEQVQSGSETAKVPVWSDDGLLDQIDTPIYCVNRKGECRRFNRAAERLFGYSQAELLGRNLHEVLHNRRPDGSPFPQEECRLVGEIRPGNTVTGILEVMWSRAGEALPVECSVAAVTMGGEAGSVITMKDLRPQQQAEASLLSLQEEAAEVLRQRDVASRMEREMALAEANRQRYIASQLEHTAAAQIREQQDLLDSVVQTTPVGIAVLDENLRFRWHNPAYEVMLRSAGAPVPAPGVSFLEVVSASPEVEAILREVQRTGVPFQASAYAYDTLPNGRTYWNWSLKRLPTRELLVTAQNVTEQTLSQQALVESDKMAAVGRLAASISHEINNPLEAVTNLLYLLHGAPELSEESRSYIETAETELSRVSRIASETLRFHRHAVEAVHRTPKQLVDPVLALYAGKLKSSRVQVSTDYDAAPPVKTFEGDVRQILNNLIGNAIDAMQRGGDLRVRTRPAICPRTGRKGLRISVIDSGHGMSPETAAHIFEPFYTTKGASGSGLGLWISHTLAERQGGKLMVRSCHANNPLGKPSGTTFSLFIPSQDQAPQAATIQ